MRIGRAKRIQMEEDHGLRIGLSASGPTYDVDAAAFMARISTPPTTQRAALINSFFVSDKATGAYAATDCMWLTGAADSQAARQNLKSAGYTLSPFNSPAFTVDRGYAGDGVAAYLASGYDPTTLPAGMVMQQDNAHIGIFVLTAGATNGYDAGSANNRGKVRGRPAVNGATGGVSTTSVATMTAAGTVPMSVMVVRRDSANQLLFVNGVQVATAANASAGLPSAMDLLRAAASYGDRMLAFYSFGAAPSDAQILGRHNACVAYAQGIGAA